MNAIQCGGFTAEAQSTQRAAENEKGKHNLDCLSLPRFLCVLCASAVRVFLSFFERQQGQLHA
jgi:hypothetical protein